MTRAGLLLAALAVAAALAACGSGEEPERPAQRTGGAPTLPDGKDRASREQIEAFARIDLPTAAEDVHSFHRSGMDSALDVSFTLPREQVEGFLRAGNFTQPLQDGFNPFTPGAGRELGWKLEGARDVRGLNEVVDQEFGRLMAVVGADGPRPTVHLSASTM